MNSHLQKLGVLTTIVSAFIGAASGSSISALVFWIALFLAAVSSGPNSGRATDCQRDRRFM